MRAIRVVTVCLALLVIVCGQIAAAPLTLNHQGRLTDNSGAPLTGTYTLTFKLYSTASGGAALWSETQVVNTVDGLYEAVLGEISPLSSSLFSGAPAALYLGIMVGADGELAPRTQLTSSPYSLHSASVEGFSSGPGNVNTGAFSIVGGDNNTNNSDYSTIFGEDNEVNVTEFADTVFDTSGIVPSFLPFSGAALHPPGNGTILGGHGNIVCGNHAVIVQGWLNINCAPYSFIGTGFRNTIYAPFSTLGTGLFNNITSTAGFSVLGGGALNNSNGFNSVIGGGAFNTTTAGSRGEVISGGWRNTVEQNFSTIGGGESNRATDIYATVGGGQFDTAFSPYSTVAGGARNSANGAESFVGGGSGNRAEGTASAISGGSGNTTAVHDHQFVGGGQDNRAFGPHSTIGGGWNNETSTRATVGGGVFNHATNEVTFIGGGIDNLATAFAAAVGGGSGNTSSGDYAAITGGQSNIAGPGAYATVPGGFDNEATASNTFAAGRGAKAKDSCSFVWADCCVPPGLLTSNPYYSSIDNSFNARATNGFYFLTSCDSTFDPAAGVGSGVFVPPGGSMWMTGSSRTLKKNIKEVDESDILKRVDKMPIYRWSYKNQGDEVVHMGPMAEDFYETFKLGDDNRAIGTLDPAGVSLAATKALIKENKELKRRLEELEKLVHNLADQM
ncbi:MAG: tail fiber domain-containing protein [bacterium]|nr:tail fiber domain-containing protein [bacterium]